MLKAVARIRELGRVCPADPSSRWGLYAVARIRELARPMTYKLGSLSEPYSDARIGGLKPETFLSPSGTLLWDNTPAVPIRVPLDPSRSQFPLTPQILV
jgi:hypothetical protein